MSAVLFDALGTLVRLEPPALPLRQELSDRLGVSVSEEAAEQAIIAEIAYYRAHLDEGRDRVSLAVLRRQCASVLIEALPALAGAEVDEVVEVLLASLRFSAFEDAAPCLTALRGRGRRIVVVSNWDISLGDVLDRVGLASLVDGVVTSASVGARKPAREMFTAALSLAGVSADQALHVGDSLEEDVEGALSAGIEPVLLAREGGPAPAGVRTIERLTALL
jgi:putative hydrolase of the HAD superfamily